MDLAEQLTARLRIFAILQAISFFAWQAGEGVARSSQIPDALTGPAFLVSGIGVGVWLVSLIIFFGLAWQAKKAVGYDVLNDEWARDVRKRGAEAAFWIVTVAVVLAMTATNFGADGQLLLKVITGLAVSSFLIANVWYDSRGEDEAEE